ncbi:pancreatic triacylglycerol lipase-like [Anoplolepis gracilipes]|uniref:pancreatic triacylglycerol lipase-like n=1 Tax=Anoplolepis gracilipes TaxID=354296 RepID=UPI003B9EFBD4
MEIRILIGLLLICVVAGLPVEEKSYNDIFTPNDYAILKNMTAYMYDDNENLVKLTLDDYYMESVKETQEDIENRVFFSLYTKKNPTVPQSLYVNDEYVLKNSNFDPTKPTRFITHGWMNSRNSPACYLSRDAYVKSEDCNVIVIDWSKISIRPYIWASQRVGIVGQFVSTMIDFLEEQGMDLSKTLLVGHSLGAHIVGLAARNAQGKVNFVVGLDPAFPGFSLAGPGSRISYDDAQYVEIIHTNGGLLGFLTAIGDSDFYPNGGEKQLGCLLDFSGACSHARSFRFFAESIDSPRGFHGRKCNSFIRFKKGLCDDQSTSLMGHKSELHAYGTYYLVTNSKSPYANGPILV